MGLLIGLIKPYVLQVSFWVKEGCQVCRNSTQCNTFHHTPKVVFSQQNGERANAERLLMYGGNKQKKNGGKFEFSQKAPLSLTEAPCFPIEIDS